MGFRLDIWLFIYIYFYFYSRRNVLFHFVYFTLQVYCQEKGHFECSLEVALGCWASAIIYKNTWVYGDYQLIIAINASTRQLTVQPSATSNAHISTKHEPSIVTFAISSRKRMGHWRNVLKQDMKTLDTTATCKQMQIHHQEQGQFENTHINWTWGYMIQVQSLWLLSKMEPQCKSSYACSARKYVQK